MQNDAFRKAMQQLQLLEPTAQIDKVGDLINDAERLGDSVELAELATEARHLAEQQASDWVRAESFYQLGNALLAIHRIRTEHTPEVHYWNQPELRQGIFAYRRAVATTAESNDHRYLSRRVQSLTNLANTLSHIGRSLDAIEYYDRAIDILPTFAMAIGNRAFAIECFCFGLYDPSHRTLGHRFCVEEYTRALALEESLEPHAEVAFTEARDRILRSYSPELMGEVDWPTTPIAKTKEEEAYRNWCFEHRLFINDSADFLPEIVAAQDITSLPPIVQPLALPQQYFGLFNLMKQEFITGRWLCYDGLTNDQSHFSDREALFYDTNDTAIHSNAVEKVRIGTRAAFSVLDKIGYFVSLYWNLGHEPKRLSFRNVWYVQLESKKGINPALEKTENNTLRGLYWLSLDFNDTELQEVLEHDTQGLQELRNFMEHRFVKIVELESLSTPDVTGDLENVMKVGRLEFNDKALRILKLVRRALLYLTVAVHIEEARRSKERGDVPLGAIKLRPSER